MTLSGTDYTCPTHGGALRPPVSLPRRWTARPATAALLAADGTYGGRADRPAERRLQRRDDAGIRITWPPTAGRIFRRAKLTDLLAEYGADTCNGLVLVPFRSASWTTARPDRRGLQRRGAAELPVLADVGSIAINAGTSADGLKAAKERRAVALLQRRG